MQQALIANGYLGLFTNQIQYAPNLVAPAVERVRPDADRAGRERGRPTRRCSSSSPTCRRSRPDQPIDQSVIAGYWSADLFLAAVQKAGQEPHARVARTRRQPKFTYEVPNTVGPTVFPAAHSMPTPCGALVSSNGTAYAVKVPYTCGRVVPIR